MRLLTIEVSASPSSNRTIIVNIRSHSSKRERPGFPAVIEMSSSPVRRDKLVLLFGMSELLQHQAAAGRSVSVGGGASICLSPAAWPLVYVPRQEAAANKTLLPSSGPR